MKAVLMAGGEGTRLRPLTTRRPKPLAPVLGRPIMEHILLLLRDAGIKDVVVTVHYLADQITEYFGDGSALGMHLIYSVEDTPLGTAGSVKQAEEHLRDGTFVIVSGDALTDIDLRSAFRMHEERKADATLVLAHVPNPLEFGIVVTESDGRIRRFLEKPSWGEVFSDTVNTGMYVLEPSVFDYMEAGRSYDWSQDIFPKMLAEDKQLWGHVMSDYWCDIGNLSQYREAQYTVLEGRTGVPLPGVPAKGNWIGEGTTVNEEARLIAPVLLGRNVTVKAGAQIGPYAVVGDNCIIESGAEVHRSVLWEGVYVGPGTRLSACTVCSHAILQGDCEIMEGAVIGERCRVEHDSVIRPQVKLWPDKHIEAGATVTMSLIWGQKWQGALFGELGVSGVANIEITPEFATRLGAAFGAFHKAGSTVMTARDSGPAARMVKRALIAGLMSVGCKVVDLRSAPLPIMRHTLRNSGAAGGVYVRLSPEDPRMLLVEFLDGNGVYCSKASERKIETVFFREDFRRVDADRVGTLEFSGRSVEQYQEDYLRHLDVEPIRARNFKIAVDFSFSRVATVFGGALGRLACDVVALNAFVDARRTPHKGHDRAGLLLALSHTVQTLSCDLGVMIENDGERLTVVDENGAVIEDDALLMLFAVLIARTRQSARIAVPVTAPARLEGLLEFHGATARRTKTDVRSLLAASAQTTPTGLEITAALDRCGGFSFPEFHNAFDGMYAVSKLLEALAVTGLGIGEVLGQLPPVHVRHAQLHCPWDAKGRVMLEVSRAAGDGPEVDLTDGVKVWDGMAWTLVLPDSAEPHVHVYAEDKDAASAEARLVEVAARVKALIGASTAR